MIKVKAWYKNRVEPKIYNYKGNTKDYNGNEIFPIETDIERAMRQIYKSMDKGRIQKVVFMEVND